MYNRIYTVLRGDTPSAICHKLTGFAETWPGLVRANPQLRRRMTRWGPTFADEDFVEGTKLYVPEYLVRGFVGQSPGEYAGEIQEFVEESVASMNNPTQCIPGAIMQIKDYVYIVQPNEYEYLVAQHFGMGGSEATGWTWPQLNAANFDDPGKFYTDEHNGCRFQNWKVRKKLRIPASWPDPDPSIYPYLAWYDPGDFNNNPYGQTIVRSGITATLPGTRPKPTEPKEVEPQEKPPEKPPEVKVKTSGPSGGLVVGLIGVAAVGAYALLSAMKRRV